MDEFFNCGFSVMIPYVQHLCTSGTNAWGLRHQSTSCWCATCAIVSEKSPNRKEIWREISWFWQGNLTGKKEILHSKREISLKTYGSTGWTEYPFEFNQLILKPEYLKIFILIRWDFKVSANRIATVLN
jgi:hypothetical protein